MKHLINSNNIRWQYFLMLFIAFSIYGCNSPKEPQISSDFNKIFLVRHAEKADDGTKDPPLTEAGEARAAKIKDLLMEQNITKIYSSNYKRTLMTAKPLAEQLGIDIQLYDPADLDIADKLKEEAVVSNIFVVGHSNSIPALVNKIIGKDSYKDLKDSEYSKLFIIEVDGANFMDKVQEFQP